MGGGHGRRAWEVSMGGGHGRWAWEVGMGGEHGRRAWEVGMGGGHASKGGLHASLTKYERMSMLFIIFK